MNLIISPEDIQKMQQKKDSIPFGQFYLFFDLTSLNGLQLSLGFNVRDKTSTVRGVLEKNWQKILTSLGIKKTIDDIEIYIIDLSNPYSRLRLSLDDYLYIYMYNRNNIVYFVYNKKWKLNKKNKRKYKLNKEEKNTNYCISRSFTFSKPNAYSNSIYAKNFSGDIKRSFRDSIISLFCKENDESVIIDDKVIYYFNPNTQEFSKDLCKITYENITIIKSKKKIPVASIITYKVYQRSEYPINLNTKEKMNYYFELLCKCNMKYLFGVRKEKNKDLFNNWFNEIITTYNINKLDNIYSNKINNILENNREIYYLFIDHLFDVKYVINNKKIRNIIFECIYDTNTLNIIHSYIKYKELIKDKQYLQAIKFFTKAIQNYKLFSPALTPPQKLFFSEFDEENKNIGHLFSSFRDLFILPLLYMGRDKVKAYISDNGKNEENNEINYIYMKLYIDNFLIYNGKLNYLIVVK